MSNSLVFVAASPCPASFAALFDCGGSKCALECGFVAAVAAIRK